MLWNQNWTVGTYQIKCGMLPKLDMTMTWLIVQLWFTLKNKLSCHERLDQVRSMMYTWRDNNLRSYGCGLCRNYTELLGLIGPGVVCEKKQTGQQCDRSYKCGLCRNGKWTIMTDQIGCSLWWKLDQKWCDRSYNSGLCWNQNWTVLINRNECQLWWKPDRTMMWLIVQIQSMPKMILTNRNRSCWVWFVTKNQKRKRHDRSYRFNLCPKQNRAIITNRTGCNLWQKPDKPMMWPII